MAVYENLVKLMEKQVNTQKSLLEIEGRKTSVLAKNDIEALTALIKLEQPLVMRCAAFERQYGEIMRELSLTGLSFKQYVDGLNPESARTIENGLKELSVTARRLKRAVGVNVGILSARQRTIRQLLAVCGVQDQAFTYNKEGRYTLQTCGV
jgi:flagellar biosynthesis/type III secretory pathway chaperone